MDLLLNLRRTVSNFPDAPAIVDGDVRMTWRDYDQDTRKLAAGLVELGLQPGDRIAVLALNSYRYAELYYWVIRMSGIIVPLVAIGFSVVRSARTRCVSRQSTFGPLMRATRIDERPSPEGARTSATPITTAAATNATQAPS